MSGEVLLLGALVMSVLWLVIGWRLMRAHERIAAVYEREARPLDLFARQSARPSSE